MILVAIFRSYIVLTVIIVSLAIHLEYDTYSVSTNIQGEVDIREQVSIGKTNIITTVFEVQINCIKFKY